jgi:hypothetical protein
MASAGRSARSPRARRTAAQRAAALLGDGRWLDTGARRRRGGGGSPVRRRRCGVTTTGDGRARRGGGSGDGSARTAGARTRLVGAVAALARQLSAARVRRSGCGGEREARSGGGRGEVTLGGTECGALSGRSAVGVARGRRAGLARRATADKRGPLVSDFRIKIYLEGN